MPSTYGFTNTTDRCYTGDDTGFTGGWKRFARTLRSTCGWDGIHPTTALHTLLGQRMLAAVPEPGTLLLMGLALALGFARRLGG
jgi:phospholipase/lecithinase/hemolysin